LFFTERTLSSPSPGDFMHTLRFFPLVERRCQVSSRRFSFVSYVQAPEEPFRLLFSPPPPSYPPFRCPFFFYTYSSFIPPLTPSRFPPVLWSYRTSVLAVSVPPPSLTSSLAIFFPLSGFFLSLVRRRYSEGVGVCFSLMPSRSPRKGVFLLSQLRRISPPFWPPRFASFLLLVPSDELFRQWSSGKSRVEASTV